MLLHAGVFRPLWTGASRPLSPPTLLARPIYLLASCDLRASLVLPVSIGRWRFDHVRFC